MSKESVHVLAPGEGEPLQERGIHEEVNRKFRAWCKRRGIPEGSNLNQIAKMKAKKP